MTRKRSKRVKMRGSQTHGYGSKKKHRGGGSKGGKGFAGSYGHKKVYLKKYQPEHFEKRKFKSLRERGFSPHLRAINLRDLSKLIKKMNLKEVDLQQLGYDKILSAGELTEKVTIKNALFSERAKEKIQKSGSTISQ